MFIAILQHTPTWVFFLLAGLVALGVLQAFPRSVTLRRTIILPLALLGWSLQGVASNFGHQPVALLAWAGGVVLALSAVHGRIDTSAVRYAADSRRFQVPGSWLPLVLILSLFTLKFCVGVMLAMEPALRQSTGLATAVCAGYGLFSGLFLARSVALWAVARRAQPGLGQLA
jgi:hypothetical protein